ncbi:outer membrane beta-barrel protein [Pedobacter sp. MC2016-15]|uniref:outer membrane beta-barrel protein n=1 Tax=Pedobacter sp. MC2016-15 TaxID=2994473 RepID=UPI0022457C5A|nr:outer membrane beta-barrel protein [Pedobacter sp. MC2016-15]MCX2480902.1 outer membrane beta-barrel protein [Pedobacter sp. MC2016-15]
MKKLLSSLLLISGLIFQQAAAQDTTMTTTTATVTTTPVKNRNYKLDISFGDREDTVKTKQASKGRFLGGLTFTRVDLGFSRLIDNGSFSLSPENKFLDYKGAKTTTFSFDVVYFGYRFNPIFKMYIAGGFDWTLIRLKNNVTIQQNTPDLTYIDEPIDFSKNRFSSSYVHIPLNFELRSKENHKGKRFYFVFGPEVSFLLNGKVKQISDERGKQKFRDDYNFQPVRLGGTVRLGYGGIGLFTKYYFNDMFDSAPQAGLKNMAFGLTFGLN